MNAKWIKDQSINKFAQGHILMSFRVRIWTSDLYNFIVLPISNIRFSFRVWDILIYFSERVF
jgi:hypothetical protein